MLLALLVAGVAAATTLTETDSTRWNVAGHTASNLTIGNQLNITTVDTSVDDFYRAPWDATNWEEQGDKDNGNLFTDPDRCLRDTENAGLATGPTVTANGHEHRTGPHVTRIAPNNYVSTLPTATPVPLPLGTTVVNQVRFLTSGAHIANTSYTVRFHYNDVGTPQADVVVPIVVDSVTGPARSASDLDYTVVGVSTFTHNPDTGGTWDADSSGATDCGGDGGDEVTVTNPFPGLEVTDIEFLYADYNDANASAGWLSGPLSLTLLVDQADYDLTYQYSATWNSATSTSNATKATANAVWKQITWSASNLASGSDIEVIFTCGNDTNSNGTLEASELAPGQVISLASDTSPYTLPATCSGRYVQYELDFFDRLDDNPTLSSIAFVYDLDGDQDGYDATVDCDDGDSTVHPGATEIAGNNVDEDCSNDVDCYDDTDNDGARTNNVDPGGINGDLDCNDGFEGQSTDPIDCDDTNSTIKPSASEVAGNNVDENCDSKVACYTDADDDGDRLSTTFTTSVGDTNCTDPNEGLSGDLIDCNDGNGAINHAATEIKGDEIDQNCDGQELCWPDADNDGERASSGQVTSSTNTTCQNAGEGATTDTIDCNDGDGAVNHTATEIAGDNVDQNCDTKELCYTDVDNDGDRLNTTFLTSAGDTDCTGANEGLSTDLLDCNDGDGAINHAATEVKGDEIDQNCDGQETCWPDADHDGDRASTGFVVSSTNTTCQDLGEGATTDPVDCDDSDATRNSGLPEVVGDGLDQDCDTHDDCYQDLDHDGHGTSTVVTSSGATCLTANGESTVSDDCDDGSASRYPGNSETIGNNVDNDCNNREKCYTDADDDGARLTTSFETSSGDTTCTGAREGESGDPIDCDDSTSTISPLVSEVPGDNVDENCDTREDCYTDADDDNARLTTTFTTSAGDTTCNGAREGKATDPIDCDDTNGNVHPGAAEVTGDNVDEDCDTRENCFTDADDDGARLTSIVVSTNSVCTDAREGEASDLIDCNDSNSAIHPGATELAGDNVDQNCDNSELCYRDNDDDGNRTNVTFSTTAPDTNCTDAREGLATDPIDCNDADSTINSFATELKGDEVDQNCDGQELCWPDVDNDDDRASSGQVTSTNVSCGDANEGRTTDTVDCDDNNADRASKNNESSGTYIANGVDNNCDGKEVCYVDSDGDGARTSTTVVSPNASCGDAGEALATANVDCDDADDTSYPGATEIVANQVDNDCNGGEICYVDFDKDTYRVNTTVVSPDRFCTTAQGEAPSSAGPDCDDTTNSTHPGAPDQCGNGVDDNCNGVGDNGFPSYLDDDGDGLTWSQEQALGTDDCNDDSDNDTLSDDDEVNLLDTDPTKPDTDNDGMRDDVEVGTNPGNPRDTDGDGTIDALDTDDDGDGVLSILEDINGNGNPIDDDNDGDTIPNPRDDDDDNDGILTILEDVNRNGNWADDQTDGDGKPDWLDSDDDGDNVATSLEDVNRDGDWSDDDTDGDGKPNYRDSDDDGDTILTTNEDANGNGNRLDDDTDSDGKPNFLDDEDDGDGILTRYEASDIPNADVDGDGTPNRLDSDSDGDGFTDAVEGRVDSDRDNTYDYLDLDSDNDTVTDATEAHADSDGDTVTNRLDTDDDGDGVPTSREHTESVAGLDADNDGTPNYLDLDSDADGWNDAWEWTVLHSGIDEDGDGRPNYVDTDSDADRLPDNRELGTMAAPVDTDNDGAENRIDADDDGDNVQTTVELGANPNNPADQDGDSVANYLDTDDDDDGELTSTEVPGGGTPDTNNTDGDGLANYLDDDDDGDGVLTFDELHVAGATRDVDGDGTPNHPDTDSDGDGFGDSEEAPNGNLVNTDGTDVPDFVDTDSDNDHVLDRNELHTNTDQLSPNGDNLENRRDPDDDGDEIPTAEECSTTCGDTNPMNDDWDGDLIADFLDEDDDGDFVPTLDEDWDNSGDPRDDNTDGGSVQGDQLPDYLDTDDDGDGLTTIEEDLNLDGQPIDDDTDGDGKPNYRDEDDDNDTLPTWQEVATPGADPRGYDFPDLDGLPNYLDPDDDNDHIDTGCEIPYAVPPYDRMYLTPDSDGDTIVDGDEWTRLGPVDPNNSTGTGCNNPWDFDQDGRIDALDADDDNDGLPTGSVEPPIDLDCAPGTGVPQPDGLPAYVDTDSDNDGKPDGLDYGAPFFEEGPNSDGDGDGIPDYLDCDNSGAAGDSDSDGILNGDEQQLCVLFGLSGTDCTIGLLLDPDYDNDMVLDGIELGFGATPLDTDGDGIYDIADPDDDDDGIPTAVETVDVYAGTMPDPEACANEISHYFSVAGSYWTFFCTDGSGNELDFDFGDDTIDVYWNLDCDDNGGANPECSYLVETPDADPNFRDADDDGDGKSTADELALPDDDVDGDGLVNWYDPWDGDGADGDADGDGLTKSVEEALGTDPYNDDTDHDGITDDVEADGATVSDDAPDHDGDGLIDALDGDDDGDGVDTVKEGSADVDGDGDPNYLDDDSDGDGKPDAQEGASSGTDTDCDGILDVWDANDADGSCDSGDSGKNSLVYTRQGCGGCSSGAVTPGPAILLIGAAALAFRRRQRK